MSGGAARRRDATRRRCGSRSTCRDEDVREPGPAASDLIGRLAEIGLDRLVAFPTRWSPTLEAQAAFADDCRAAGMSLGEPVATPA